MIGTLSVVAIEFDWAFWNQCEDSARRAKLGNSSALISPWGVTIDESGNSSSTSRTTGTGLSTTTDGSAEASGCQTSSEDSEKNRNITSASAGRTARMLSQRRTAFTLA